MFNILRFKSSKKSMLALETILGLVLSVIILFFIFQTFYNAFLQTPTNLKIAEDNAKSIVEFVDYSNKQYLDIPDCYSVLKLKNLENYQYESKDDKNYFYIIDDKSIYILNSKDYESIFNEKKFNDNFEKKIDFPQTNLNLKFDSTNVGGLISIDTWFFSGGGTGNDIKLSSNNLNFLLLQPKFSKSFFNSNFLKLSENQNILYGYSFFEDKIKENNGFYLVFKPHSKDLFLSKSTLSNSIINTKNCAFKKFKNNYNLANGYDFLKTDYINNELKFDYLINNQNQNFIFTWSINGITCPNNNCKSYFGNNYNDLSYLEFLDELRIVYKKDSEKKFNTIYKNTPKVTGNLKIIDLKYIGDSIQKQIQKKNYYSSKFIFNKYENLNLNFKINELNDETKIESNLEKEFGDLVFKGFGTYRKNCNYKICNYIGVKKNKVYYYSKDYNSFVTIRQDLFKKNNEYLYFMGNKVKNNKGYFDDVQVSIVRGNQPFNIYNVNTIDGIRTIILSPGGFNNLENLR